MVSDRGKGTVEVSGGDQEGVALKRPGQDSPAGAFTVEASLSGQGGIGTAEQSSLRDGPGGCLDKRGQTAHAMMLRGKTACMCPT